MSATLIADRDRLEGEIDSLEAESAGILEHRAEDGTDVSEDEEKKLEANTALIARKQSHLKQVKRLLDRTAANEKAKKTVSSKAEAEDRADRGRKPKPEVKEGDELRTYHEGGSHQVFRDLAMRHTGVGDYINAQARITAHLEEEMRASTVANMAGLVPPNYLTERYAEKRQKGRAFGNYLGSEMMPAYGENIIVPRETTNATAGVQATEGDNVSKTDVVMTDLSIPVDPIAGEVEISRKASDRSFEGIVDTVVMNSLMRALATQCGNYIINDATNGLDKAAQDANSALRIAYNDTSPTVGELYGEVGKAKAQVVQRNLSQVDTVLMHPRRWEWIWSQVDSDGRPLISGFRDTAQNPIALTADQSRYQGIVGYLNGNQVAIVTDHNVSTTQRLANTGTQDQDPIYVLDSEDLMFFESGVQTIDVDQVGANKLQLGWVAYQYIAFTAKRYPDCVGKILGTGLSQTNA